MKSKVFSNFDADNDENRAFKKDLRTFVAVPPDVRNVCISELASVLLALTPDELEKKVAEIERRAGTSGVQVTSVLQLGRFFVRIMLKPGTRDDTTAAWAEDLQELGFLSRPEADTFIQAIEKVRCEVLPAVEPDLRKREYATGVLPSLRSCGVTVELRGLLKDKYHWGTPVNEYRPEVVGIVPVASVHLGVDSGTQQEFFFQASKNELKLLINNLVAAGLELDALESVAPFHAP